VIQAILAILFVFSIFCFGQDNEKARFYFNPLKVRRDPFLPPAAFERKGVNELTSFELNEMSLVAVLSGMGAAKAMILLPNGKTHIVQRGDAIGRNRGRVSAISGSEVVVKESFKDYKGSVKTSTAKLVLEE